MFVPFYISILGIEAYGLIAFYSVMLSLTALADIGLSSTFSREAARTPDKKQLLDLLATIERLLLATTFICAVSVVLFAEIIASRWLNINETIGVAETATCLRLMAITLIPQLLLTLYSAGLLGLQKQVLANALQIFYITFRSGLVIVMIAWKPEPIVFFGWQLAATAIFAIGTRVALLHTMGHSVARLGRFSFATTAPLISFASGMLAISIISSVNTQLDKLVVSKMFTVAEFGYYSLGSTLAQLPVAATAPLMVALFPRFTALIAQGEQRKADRLYEIYSCVIAFLAALGAGGLFFFSDNILTLWLGGASTPASVSQIVKILSAGGLLLSLQLAPFYLALAHGHNRTSIILGATTLIFTVPLLFVTARAFGLVGAAIPWVALNFITFAVLAAVIGIRFYDGKFFGWFLNCTITPVALGVSIMYAGHVIADMLLLSSLAAFFLAGMAALAGVSGLGLWLRKQVRLDGA